MEMWIKAGIEWRYGAYLLTWTARGWLITVNRQVLELMPELEAAKAWTVRYATNVELARRAQTDLAVARRAFRKLARANGYTGEVGGWIYHNGGPKAIAQGWQQLADRVASGHIRFTKVEA